MNSNANQFVAKLRGLPWSATANEVVTFLDGVNIVGGKDGIHFTFNREGRPSGECFVVVASQQDFDKAKEYDNQHMGKRYIEVLEGNANEMTWLLNKSGGNQSEGSNDGVVRLRGLPYGCTKQEVAQFFDGLQIIPYGITITMDQMGKCTGDAYVEFSTPEDAEKAQSKHKEKIGHRYIEIFKSSKSDIKYVIGESQQPPMMNRRPGPYDRPSGGDRPRGRGGMMMGPSGFNNMNSSYSSGPMRGKGMRGGRGGGGGGMGSGNSNDVMNSTTGHSIHMRGLPFEASANDVRDFFKPHVPADIRILYEPSGRAKGECDVDFHNHGEAESAMGKDKQNMGHRYIELFLKSTPQGNRGGMGMSEWGSGGQMRGMGGGGYDSMGPGMMGGMGGGYGGYADNVSYPSMGGGYY